MIKATTRATIGYGGDLVTVSSSDTSGQNVEGE